MKLSKEQREKISHIVDDWIRESYEDRMIVEGSFEDTIEEYNVFEKYDCITISIEIHAAATYYRHGRYDYDDVGEVGYIVGYSIDFNEIRYYPADNEDEDYVCVEQSDLDNLSKEYCNREYNTIEFY